jgi:hypothetical protein
VENTGDNYYMKLTSILELQERGNGVQKSTSNPFPINTRSITAPDLFIGSVLFLGKKTPTPRLKINPFAKIDHRTGRLIPDKETRNKLDIIDHMLTGRVEENENILKNMQETEDATTDE